MHTKAFDLHVKDVSEEGTFVGYGAVFGNLDRVGDIIDPGAFAKSLARHTREKTSPLMLWNHNPSEPIGVWEDLEEDGKGLRGKGRLVLETTKGREAHALLKAGAVRGLSIGYRTIKGEPSGNAYKLKEVDLVEISLTAMPANPKALITGVKSEALAADLEEFARRLRDGEPLPVKNFEDILREAGVPKAMATQIASVGYAKAIRGEPEGKANEPELTALKEALASLKSLSS
ncbi:HK97 family phage prohead protease [Falsigemmobacter faecalis]|uniref:HK97 family phage prohead protease n=1 Tax=Falsigemmobacter faecalis TaxID=2488730 RepID=A0A3P3DER9_9RHOB|nr:HK97 family phage prohead protease [Falsigemmobacter faecalis]RRH72002.1 HK97 family phage prohead protease [Falsigemmobacter faecalis]